jgi:TM2 domain-containing membrane protein YozV
MNIGKGLATLGLCLMGVVAICTIIGLAFLPLILDAIIKIWREEES